MLSLQYYKSKTNEELGQVFTTSQGANGNFPGNLELAMKIVIIAQGVGLIVSASRRRVR